MKKYISAVITVLILLNSAMGATGLSQSYGLDFTDPYKTSDQAFFGEWDSYDNKWSDDNPGRIDYSYSADLSELEKYVKQGDYQSAKSEWLYYLTNRKFSNPKMISRDYEFAELLCLNIMPDINNVSLAGQFSVTNEYKKVECDVSKVITKTGEYCFQISEKYKADGGAVFDSKDKDGGFAPTLTVRIGNQDIVYTAINDTYVAPEEYKNTAFGHEDNLYVAEKAPLEGEVTEGGRAWTRDTRRTMLQFDLSDISDEEIISHAKLTMNGKALGEKSDMIVWTKGDTAWDENEYTWVSSVVNLLSWQGDAAIDWTHIPDYSAGVDREYSLLLSRVVYVGTITGCYSTTGNEYYAYHAIRHMIDFITQTGERVGTFSALDTGIRSRQIIANYRSWIGSPSLTAEANTAITKYIWESSNFLSFDINWRPDHNHGSYEILGFIRMATYFPEFKKAEEWKELIIKRCNILIGNVVRPDGSYKESTTGYAIGVYDHMIQMMQTGEEFGFNIGNDFYEKVYNALWYGINTMFPNTGDIQYGDTGYAIRASTFKNWAKFYDDDEILYIATRGQEGKEPERSPSVLYNDNHKMGIMKTGWLDDDIGLAINNGSGDNLSHTHDDNLSLVLYAYGRPLIIDPGTASYNTTDMVEWQKSANGHSTIVVNNRKQSRGTGLVDLWAANKGFDFYQSTSKDFNPIEHTRNVFFVKNSGFFIVSDQLVNTQNTGNINHYEQNWQFPRGQISSVDEETKIARTNFKDGANILVIPVDKNVTPVLREGYQSMGGSTIYKTKYVTYEKDTANNTSFDTILYPIKDNSNKISTNKIDTGVDSSVATAMEINIDNDKGKTRGLFYLSHEKAGNFGERAFDKFTYDGKCVYIDTNNDGFVRNASILSGKNLVYSSRDLICYYGTEAISDLYIEWVNGKINMSSETLTQSDLSKLEILSQTSSIIGVTLNGESIPFRIDGEFVYFGDERPKYSYTAGADINFNILYTLGNSNYNGSMYIPAGSVFETPTWWSAPEAPVVLSVPTANINVKAQLTLNLKNAGVSSDRPMKLVLLGVTSKIGYISDNRLIEIKKQLSSSSDITNASLDSGGFAYLQDSVGKTIYFNNFKEIVVYTENETSGNGNATDTSRPSPGGGSPSVSPTGGGVTTPVISDYPKAKAKALPFGDILGHWAENEIFDMYNLGIVNGSDGQFYPDNFITRAEFAKITSVALNLENIIYDNVYYDVGADDWYKDYVKTVSNAGIMVGFDRHFRPNDRISREEMAKVIVSVYEKYNGEILSYDDKISGYTDSSDISGWALTSFSKSIQKGFINGDENKLYPIKNATKAEAVVMLKRLLSDIK